MIILVTGASGFIGRPLCTHLQKMGHTLRILSRSPDAMEASFPAAKVMEWEPLTETPPVSFIEGVSAVIHLAGESVAGSWKAPGKKQAIRESRVLGTRHLVQAFEEATLKPELFISASAIGYYGDRGEDQLEESEGPGNDFLASVCSEWEAEAGKAVEAGIKTTCLRIGVVLGRDGGALKEMIPHFRKGMGGSMGSGRQWWSWIHLDDLIGLIQHLLENPADGPVNATAPEPVRQKEFARALGRELHKPTILPIPAFALRMLLGEFASELLTSRRVVPAKALETGFTFKFQVLEGALTDIIQ